MERKLGMGLMLVVGGLSWSCVTPAEVDQAGTQSEAQEEASADSGSGAGQASSAEGSGGTEAQSSAGGATGGAATGGTDSHDDSTNGGSNETSMGGNSSGEGPTGQAAGGAAAGGATAGGAPPTDDICPFDGELEYDPAAAYPFCNGDESFAIGVPLPTDPEPVQNRCRGEDPGSLVGVGISVWSSANGSPDDEPVDYCLCLDACAADSDCPAGDGGNAQPLCLPGNFGNNSCLLTCDSGETCPDGMTCTEGNSDVGHRVCAWGTRGAGCDTSEWPAVTP